jgi:DNA-binding IclR family transcriptional regulator
MTGSHDRNEVHALMESDCKYFFIRSFAKGMKALELLSDNEFLTVSQLAKLMSINRASSHRFLSTLKELGYADKDDSSRYYLTSKVIELGMKVLDRFEIRKIARPFLQELSNKFNETTNLGYFNGEEVLTIDKMDSTERLRMDAGIGGGEPAYCTSLGKAILAFLPDRHLDEYLQTTELIPFTPNTVISKDKLMEELRHIKENGYAIDDEELSIGLRCVGAPLFDHNGQVRYAISLSGPSIRMGSKKIEEMRRELKKICQILSGKMGNYHF